eukprot:scaffold6.g2825.t1
MGPLVAGILCLALCGLARGQAQAPAAPQPNELPPFSAISVCVPFNVLISPGSYGLTIQAEPAAADAIANATRVQDDTLLLQSGAFSTQLPIQVEVSLPADRLTALTTLAGIGSVYVQPGFNVPNFTLSGSGSAYVFGMTAQQADVRTAGTLQTVLEGSFGSVSMQSSGIATVYVSGAANLNADLTGITSLYAVPSSPSANITGTSTGEGPTRAWEA